VNDHPGHVHSHQDLLFLRPEELKCSSNPLIRSSQHPQNALYGFPLSYREIGPHAVTSPALTRSGLTNLRILMAIFFTPSLILSGISPSGNRPLRGRRQPTSKIPDSRSPMPLGVDPLQGLTFQHLSYALAPMARTLVVIRKSRFAKSRFLLPKFTDPSKSRNPIRVTPVLHYNALTMTVGPSRFGISRLLLS
jgi:hypothetical protein